MIEIIVQHVMKTIKGLLLKIIKHANATPAIMMMDLLQFAKNVLNHAQHVIK